MSGFGNITLVQALEDLRQFEVAIPGLNATRYLCAAGTVILFYDILLLLPEERLVVWNAAWSSNKVLFLVNRYLIPLLFILNNHSLGTISIAGLSTTFCRAWLPIAAVLGVTSLAIANFFVARRVYVLSARNGMIKKILIFSFIVIYSVTYASVVLTFVQITPAIEFSPIVRSCYVAQKPKFLIMTYSAPIISDVLVFLLTCYNAFDRPRHLDTYLIRQLITDGLVYFLSLLSLRLFNIVSIATLGVQFSLLGAYFIWAVITTLVNRMIIKRGLQPESDPILYDPATQETPFRPRSVVGHSALRRPSLAYSEEFLQYYPGMMKV